MEVSIDSCKILNLLRIIQVSYLIYDIISIGKTSTSTLGIIYLFQLVTRANSLHVLSTLETHLAWPLFIAYQRVSITQFVCNFPAWDFAVGIFLIFQKIKKICNLFFFPSYFHYSSEL
jgi:hypothetical protein